MMNVYLSRGLLLCLPVLTRGVTPRNVVIGGLVQMLLNVVESVLSDVGHTQVGVLPDCAFRGFQLPSEQLDHCGLASTVGTNDSHTRVESNSNADTLKDLASGAWVGEANTGHLENGLVLCLDTLKEAGFWEGKLGGGCLQVVVSLSLWHPLDKLRQVALSTQPLMSTQPTYQKHEGNTVT